MSNINTAAISGNLTRDPELKTIPSGTSVCELGVAVNKSKKTDDGYVDETSYFDVTVWGNFGELVARKFTKGDFVNIQGELQQQRWENTEGEKRSKVILIARQVDGPAMYRKADGSAPAPAQTQTDDIPF